MKKTNWIIYGAYGYTGKIITKEALDRGLKPILAGRNEAKLKEMGQQHQLEIRVFDLANISNICKKIEDSIVVLHCAGPFSETSAPMMEACLKAKTHYLDITGEISVFESAYQQDKIAKEKGVLLCPGVGFDVIPTDCIAQALKQKMPNATKLKLGFDSRSALSPGTAKTSIESFKLGGKIRENGILKKVPFGHKTRTIDFGNGEKLSMTIPWGDVSSAFHSTKIKNIEVYIPTSPSQLKSIKYFGWALPILGLSFIQKMMKNKIDKKVKGPSKEKRDRNPTYVWGEIEDESGKKIEAKVVTANGYNLTAYGAVEVVNYILNNEIQGGSMTPSMLIGSELVTSLKDSSAITFKEI